MASYPTPNRAVLLEPVTFYELMALNLTPGRHRSSENLRHHRLLRHLRLLLRTVTLHLYQHRYIYSVCQSLQLRSFQHFPFVRQDGASLGCVQLVLFGLSFAPAFSRRSGRRKFYCRHLHDTERLLVRMSTNLPFLPGENRGLLVSGASPRLLAWTASQVGVRVIKINGLNQNLRNGVSLRLRFAMVPLGRGSSPRLHCQAEIDQGCIPQHRRRVERKVAGPQFPSPWRDCQRPLLWTARSHPSS